MKLHYLQHVPFEGLGIIKEWAVSQSAKISVSQLFNNDPVPSLDSFDWLIVMGGPMGIYDHDEYPWLVEEKQLIKAAIDAGKTVIGICLGAQLIADVLGTKVYPGPQKEIGWFPIQRATDAPEIIPEELVAFHWHGDTFDLPEGAIHLASSAACRNQGFIYNKRVIGLQFHLETTPESMEALIENCGNELVDTPTIQTTEQMRAGLPNIGKINTAMKDLLDQLNA